MSEPIPSVSSEIDFQTYDSSHSTPLYLKLFSQNNITSFPLTTTGIYGPVQFLIPARVLNLKESRIAFTLSLPAQAVNGKSTWINANLASIFNRVNLTTQNSNQVLLDVSFAEHYNAMLSPLTTTKTELQNKASSYFDNTDAALPVLSDQTTAGTAGYYGYYPIENLSRSNAILNPDFNNIQYTGGYEPRRLLFSSSATPGAIAVKVEMKLSDLVPMSIFSTEQMLYMSGEQLLLSLYFNGTNTFAWEATNSTDPYAGAAALDTLTGDNIQDLRLYLCTEQNQAISTQIVDKVLTSGIQLPMAYPFVSRVTGSGTSQSQTIQLTRGWGKSLLFAAWAPFNAAGPNGTALRASQVLDHSIWTTIGSGGKQVGGVVVPANQTILSSSNYNTYMDNIPILTNSNIDVLNGEYWLYNKNHIKDSAIYSAENYAIDFAHIDNFCSDPLCYIDPSKKWDGLSLDPIHQYSFVANISDSLPMNHFICIVTQKVLSLTASGVQVS